MNGATQPNYGEYVDRGSFVNGSSRSEYTATESLEDEWRHSAVVR